MRYFLALLLMLPVLAWGQSLLPPCPAGVNAMWHNCSTSIVLPSGGRYFGEFRDGLINGRGTFTFPSGAKYVGHFRIGRWHGEGIHYRSDGSVLESGRWDNDQLVQRLLLDTNRFPFTGQVADAGQAELDRLAAELDAERKRRQALEDRLASEARERGRIDAVRPVPHQTGDGSPDDQTCRQYGFVVSTTPYANCRQQLDMVRKQQEQYETRVAAAEEEAHRRRMREFGLRLLHGQPIGEAAMAASGMPLPEQPRPVQIITPGGSIVCKYSTASRSFICM